VNYVVESMLSEIKKKHKCSRNDLILMNLKMAKNPDFVFDGEIQVDVALNEKLQERDFPFCKLKGQANVLIFPDLASANTAYKLFAAIAGSSGIGPVLLGTRKPAVVMERGSNTEDLCNMIYMLANRHVMNQSTFI